MNTPDINCLDSNYIKDTVCKIDKLQKEVVLDTTSYCVSCKMSLLSSANNTIPVSFRTYTSTPVLGNLSPDGTSTTQFFRIESVRQNRFATLRLLVYTESEFSASTYTMILDLDSVFSMQCYEPQSVPLCDEALPT